MTNRVNDDAVHRAINKWESDAPVEILLDIKKLKEHMLKEHGISFNSWLGQDLTVVDEKKYMMFLLRYGS